MNKQQSLYRYDSMSTGNLLHGYYAVNSVDGRDSNNTSKVLSNIKSQKIGLFDSISFWIWRGLNRMNRVYITGMKLPGTIAIN